MKIDPKDIPGIADDYVLGFLDESTEQELSLEIEKNAALKAAVGASRDRFLPLDACAPPATIETGLWNRIEAALPSRQSRAIADKSHAANDNRWKTWRTTAIAAIASTVLLAVGLGYALLRTTEPVVIAVLLNDRGGIHAVIEDFGDHSARVRLLERVEVPAGKTIQAWTLPSPELGPISIGLLDDERSDTLAMPDLPRPHAEQLYELTLEDEGGSPTGRPTGKIIAKGFAKLPI